MLFALLACSSEPVAVPVPESAAPKTVVVVVGCTLRADRLGAYGNERETSPYVDGLAEGGVLFENHLSNAPWTRPSVGSISTGRYPLALGIDDPAPAMNTTRGLHGDWQTTAEAFSEAGWSTIGATANPNANAVFGFAQGFDHYHEPDKLWREEHSKIQGDELVDTWLELAKGVEGDLYGQLITIDTHKPLAAQTRRPTGFGMDVMMNPTNVDQYDAAVRIFDEAVKRLDAGLAALGREDRTLVIAGDHGEGLHTPKWAGKAHGRFVYDGNVRTPFIVSGPQAAKGVRVSGLSENVDLKPTLLDLASIRASAPTDGDSRADVIRQGKTETGETHTFTQTYFGPDHRVRWTTPELSLIVNEVIGTRRGISDRGKHEVYRTSDHEQAENLYWDNKDAAKDMVDDMGALREKLLGEQKIYDMEMTDDLQTQLEALGYVEGADGAGAD